jgi:NAD(P)-dependent dehydrogenase (short-subunit alcohol dehydrogenase family)
LRGQVALVTGAGRGVGRAIAEALGEAGASVVLAARTRRQVEAAALALERAGVSSLGVACDVREPTQVRDLLAAAIRRFRRLDILVNNAGAFQIATLESTDEALWDTILDTNLKGPYLVTRAALPYLVRRRGHVLNMVSVAGRIAFPGDTAYCASKWGLLGFTNALREELRPRGVRVTALLPGAIDTPIWNAIPGRWNRRHMLRPEIVARLVVQICTQPPEASTDEVVLLPSRGTL